MNKYVWIKEKILLFIYKMVLLIYFLIFVCKRYVVWFILFNVKLWDIKVYN